MKCLVKVPDNRLEKSEAIYCFARGEAQLPHLFPPNFEYQPAYLLPFFNGSGKGRWNFLSDGNFSFLAAPNKFAEIPDRS